ncbi:MAG: DUF1844 domain-containing protein [Nitrospinota bacterium]|nr:DUF1844 domain-containing protein [Nitrospinota bacterium]
MPAREEEKQEKAFSFVDKRRRQEEEPAQETSGKAKPADAKPTLSAPSSEDAEEQELDEKGQLKAPPIDFSTFMLSLASNAVYCMGGFQDPVSGKTSINLEQAKQTIDIISLIEEKTRGNLSADEANLIKHLLYDLRMKYVEALKK